MNSFWKYCVNGQQFEVRNYFAKTELYADGVLIGKASGLFSVAIDAKLTAGDAVHVTVKGGFIPKCSLYFNDILQTAIE